MLGDRPMSFLCSHLWRSINSGCHQLMVSSFVDINLNGQYPKVPLSLLTFLLEMSPYVVCSRCIIHIGCPIFLWVEIHSPCLSYSANSNLQSWDDQISSAINFHLSPLLESVLMWQLHLFFNPLVSSFIVVLVHLLSTNLILFLGETLYFFHLNLCNQLCTWRLIQNGALILSWKRHCSPFAWTVQCLWGYASNQGQSKHPRCSSSPPFLLEY